MHVILLVVLLLNKLLKAVLSKVFQLCQKPYILLGISTVHVIEWPLLEDVHDGMLQLDSRIIGLPTESSAVQIKGWRRESRFRGGGRIFTI